MPGTVVVYPQGVNWFYEAAGERIAGALAGRGLAAERCAAALLAGRDHGSADTVLIVSLKECLASLPLPAEAVPFIGRLRSFRRRILLNYDSVYTHWFRAQFTVETDLITEVLDMNVVPQSDAPRLLGVPYHWIPEALSTSEQAALQAWAPGRPVPWAIVAHHTMPRVMLLDEAVRTLGSGGFAFLPGLRPYREGSGTLTENGLDRVLRRSNLYLWTSHHEYPFHECLRAPQAVRNGAIPAKIDAHFAARFAEVPWVFPSLDALGAALEGEGFEALYARCRAFLLSRSTEDALAALMGSASAVERVAS